MKNYRSDLQGITS